MKDDNEKFENFTQSKISSIFYEIFIAEWYSKIHKQNLFSSLKTIWNLKNHSYRAEFKQTQRIHLKSHCQMQSFYEADQKHTKKQQILHCMWVFVYKIDKHDHLQKCKIQLVICEN